MNKDIEEIAKYNNKEESETFDIYVDEELPKHRVSELKLREKELKNTIPFY